jgi:hypothetical protein
MIQIYTTVSNDDLPDSTSRRLTLRFELFFVPAHAAINDIIVLSAYGVIVIGMLASGHIGGIHFRQPLTSNLSRA